MKTNQVPTSGQVGAAPQTTEPMTSAEFEDDELPFVREECGDTMWDETILNQLIAPLPIQTPAKPQNDGSTN